MLIKHTLLYLPAQLLPAAFQFASLIVWSHFANAEVIGVVTLFISIQDFLNIAFIGFWNQYTVRFAGKLTENEDEAHRLRTTSTSVLAVSLSVQVLIALALFFFTIQRQFSPMTGLVLAVLVATRALNLFQSERGRARGDILLYSLTVMSGPVLGFLLGLLLLYQFGAGYFWIFLGFSIAQLAGSAFGIFRDGSWFAIGRPDIAVIRHALSYGMPLIVSSVLAWVTQNASRIAVSYLLGLSAAGLYSMGFGLGYRASMVAAMGVTAAAFPIAVRYSNAGDVPGALRQLSINGTLLIGVLASSLVGLALVGRDVLNLMVSASMRGPVYPIMLWSLLAGGIICVRQHFLNQVFLLKANTRPIATIAIGEAVVAIASAAIVVPYYGPVGGAIALAITSTISMLVTLRYAIAEGIIIPWRDLGRIGLATVAMIVAVELTPASHSIATLLVRVSCGGAAFLATLLVCYPMIVQRFTSRRRLAS